MRQSTLETPDTAEQAKLDVKLRCFDHKPAEFRQFFTSPYEQYAERVGESFKVLGPNTQVDAEIISDGGNPEDTYNIEFADGTTITAWGHEVCQLIRENCK